MFFNFILETFRKIPIKKNIKLQNEQSGRRPSTGEVE